MTDAHSSPSYRAPDDPGDPQAQVAALSNGCGLLDRTHHGRLRLRGEDRRRYLNGQVTCAVGDLEPGRGTYGFITSIKGRVEAELTVLATDDALWLDLPPDRTEAVRERLAKYVIVDRVQFDEPFDEPGDRSDGDGFDRAVLTLLGPKCFEVVAACASNGPSAEELVTTEQWTHGEADLAGVSVRWVREPEGSAATGGAGGVSLWLPPDGADAVAGALRQSGAVPVGWRAFERLRLDHGRPLWGVDFGEDTFPQETGLDDAVSYTKGCYLGQEVVARIHYRGGVQRHMRRLALSDEPPASEEPPTLHKDGKDVGRLTSFARSLDGEQILGLAVVHQRAESGDRLDVVLNGAVVATAEIES